MNKFFKELFTYNHHANLGLIKVFREYPDIHNERSKRIFSHILNANHVWNCRIGQQQSQYGVWDEHEVEKFEAIELNNFDRTMQIVDNVTLEQIVKYNNSKGEPFINSVQDILFHIINHSTYHRGQLASLFRQDNIPPLNTDYIFYKR